MVEISALKGTGITEAAQAAVQAAQDTKTVPQHCFSGVVEHALALAEQRYSSVFEQEPLHCRLPHSVTILLYSGIRHAD